MLKFLVVSLLVLDSLVSRFYPNLIPTKISFLKMAQTVGRSFDVFCCLATSYIILNVSQPMYET